MFRRSKFLALTCILTISVVLMLAVVISLCLSGTLGAEKPMLVFRSNSAKMVYNGSSLSDNGYSLLSGELKKGHRAKVNVTGLQEGVGKSENRLYVTILDEIGADVTDDYDVITEYGILEIKPIEIAIRTEGGIKEYDGTPLVNDQWSVTTPEALMPGDRVEVTVTGTQTEIGTSFNTCVPKFFDGQGRDVSYNYDVKNEYGLLVISKINLVVQSYPETVPYGQIAQNNEYGINSGSLMPGHVVAEVAISGRQEMPGSSPNTIDYVRIVDEITGEDVSEYYNIIKNEGVLKVESNSFSDDQVLAYVSSSKGGKIYLKDQSFGPYYGNAWGEAPEYYGTYNGYSADYLTGMAIRNAGVSQVNKVNVSWMYNGFGLPYYMYPKSHWNEYDQSSDVRYTSNLKKYSVDVLMRSQWDMFDHQSNPAITMFEKEYRDYVYSNYTDIGLDSTRQYMNSLIKQERFYGKDLDTIYRVASFIQNSAVYDLKFDPALEQEDDIAVAFLAHYKRGVCRHYAAAATMLYRAMGIPARYTEGFAVETLPGIETTVTAKQRHAWVEVYIDEMGWIMVEVTGSSTELPDEEPIELKLTLNDKHVEYGKTMPEITYKGFSDYEAEGYRFEPVYADIPYEYGKHEIRIIDFRMYDPSGADITYRVLLKQKTGTMQIYRDILFVDNFDTKGNDIYEYTYDGKAHMVTSINCNETVLAKMNRHLELVSVAQLTDVGEIPAGYEVRVVDEKGNDVSDEYRIVKEYAKLRVVPRHIEITIKDVKQSYNGSPITAKSYTISDGTLASGHKISSIRFAGSQTEIGCSDAILESITIIDATGKSVQDNYTISYIPGELRVTP